MGIFLHFANKKVLVIEPMTSSIKGNNYAMRPTLLFAI